MESDIIKNQQTPEALQEHEGDHRFKDIFNAALDGIIIIDPNEYRIVDANPKVVELLGYDRAQLIGMAVEKIHPKEMLELKKTLHEVVLGNPVQTDEFSCLKKDKHSVPADISFSSVLLKGKTYVMAMVRNITERKKAEENLKRFKRHNELILNSAGEGIYGLDQNGITTFVNPAAAKMLGWEPEELLGKPQHPVIHHTRGDGSPYPREECPIYAAFKDGAVHRVDTEVFFRKDGTSFPVLKKINTACQPIFRFPRFF